MHAQPSAVGWNSGDGALICSCRKLTAWPTTEIQQVGPANIRALNLYCNDISSIPQTELAKLTVLKRMYMNSNQLTVIPPAIGQLTCLQKLIIDNNKLRALPPEIGNLINLTQLNASSNKLSTIPREIGRLASLQLLNVCNNELAELPQEIAQLEGLQGQDEHGAPRLNASFNPLTTIPEHIPRLGTALLEYLRSLRAAAGSATLPIASDRDDSFAFRNQPAPPSTAVVAASSNSTPACSSSALLVQSSAIGSLSLNATTVFEWIRNLENSLLAAREAAEVAAARALAAETRAKAAEARAEAAEGDRSALLQRIDEMNARAAASQSRAVAAEEAVKELIAQLSSEAVQANAAAQSAAQQAAAVEERAAAVEAECTSLRGQLEAAREELLHAVPFPSAGSSEAVLEAARGCLHTALRRVEEMCIEARATERATALVEQAQRNAVAVRPSLFECKVCLEDKPPVARRAIQPCGHVCCESCVQRLASAGQPCPICRGALQGFIPIFE